MAATRSDIMQGLVPYRAGNAILLRVAARLNAHRQHAANIAASVLRKIELPMAL